MRSCDSRTKSSLGLNCTTWRSYIHGGLVLGITLLVPPTTTVLLHLPPTLGVALVAFESANNHMREASIRGLHQSQRGPRMADPILYRIPIHIVRVPVQRRTRPMRNMEGGKDEARGCWCLEGESMEGLRVDRAIIAHGSQEHGLSLMEAHT